MSAATVARARTIETPVGVFAVWTADDGALRTGWVDDGEVDRRGVADERLDRVHARLRSWFDGAFDDFLDIPLPPGPRFRRACWLAVQRVPLGSIVGYAELAAAAGSHRAAARAAGQAMRHNPVPVIVPCHRVLMADGALGGFAGDIDPNGRSLAQKRFLLQIEGIAVADS